MSRPPTCWSSGRSSSACAAQGHTVEITSRDYAQTQALLDLHGMPHTPIGRHGGASRVRKAYGSGRGPPA